MRRLIIALAASVGAGGPAAAQDGAFSVHPYNYFGDETGLTASVSLGDLDGDGDLDGFAANGRHWIQQDEVFLNNGIPKRATGFTSIAKPGSGRWISPPSPPIPTTSASATWITMGGRISSSPSRKVPTLWQSTALVERGAIKLTSGQPHRPTTAGVRLLAASQCPLLAHCGLASVCWPKGLQWVDSGR